MSIHDVLIRNGLESIAEELDALGVLRFSDLQYLTDDVLDGSNILSREKKKLRVLITQSQKASRKKDTFAMIGYELDLVNSLLYQRGAITLQDLDEFKRQRLLTATAATEVHSDVACALSININSLVILGHLFFPFAIAPAPSSQGHRDIFQQAHR